MGASSSRGLRVLLQRPIRTRCTDKGDVLLPETTAKVTALAAIATRTHLLSLALYANAPEADVLDRLRDPLAQWCEMVESCPGVSGFDD